MRTIIGRVHSERRPPGGRHAKTLLWLRTMGCLITLACSLLTVPCTPDAQPAAKGHRIALLSADSPFAARANVEAFQQGLRALGYVEGQNMTIEYRYAEGKAERLPDLAAELVRLPVDVIVTAGTNAARAAQHATRTIPIVLAAGGDPVGSGLVASLARPGGNLTGLSLMSTELEGKRLELLKEAVPTASRVGVLFNPATQAMSACGGRRRAPPSRCGCSCTPWRYAVAMSWSAPSPPPLARVLARSSCFGIFSLTRTGAGFSSWRPSAGSQ